MTTGFDQVIATVDRWTQCHVNISSTDRQATNEIQRRVERLQTSFARLTDINSRLMELAPLKTSFDASTDTLVGSLGDLEVRLKLNRADPEVPIKFTKLTEGVAYAAGQVSVDSDAELEALRAEMEGLLESYYYNAHRVLKLVQGLPGMRNFKCKEIVVVRNKLVEHADHGVFYSFGYGSTGPRVKPIGPPGRQWNDEGLFFNTKQFLDALTTQVLRHIPKDA